jgi:hypothetical protein
MNNDSTSLAGLHDIVLPPAVSWWPLATGWYMFLGILLLISIWQGYRFWQRWQANAYRRVALQELAKVKDAPAIAELLRRTALAAVPRSEIAQKTGSAWADWLANQCPDSMPPKVHQLLVAGVYSVSVKEQDVSLLRNYANGWIIHHMFSQSYKTISGE